MSLIDADWNREWMESQESRRKPDDATYWDNRSEDFRLKEEVSFYASRFIEYSRLIPGDSVLDMGCGAGALALPLARAGHEVCAVDFSVRMIELLEEQEQERGLSGIKTLVASWTDDWEAAGVPQVDVALASRSIAVVDLRSAILKLESFARRRVCFSIAAGNTPRYDPVLEGCLGRRRKVNRDFIYALNILFSLGRFPELRFITSTKQMTYSSLEKAKLELEASLGQIQEDERIAFEDYCMRHLQRLSIDGQWVWRKDYPQTVRWAHISWDKD